jgi:hypothetical protein
LVPSKYLPILLTAAVCSIFGLEQCLAHWCTAHTAAVCSIFGLEQCLAHWCTAHDMSGLVDFSRYRSFPMTCL